MSEQRFYIEGMGLKQFTADDLLLMFGDDGWELQYWNDDDDLIIRTSHNKNEYRFIFAQHYRKPTGTLCFIRGRRTVRNITPTI